jgi:hypothetical protein
MWFGIDLLVRADADDEALHEVQLMANTYAIVDIVEVARDPESGDPRFTARIDAPSAEAALGALLTVIGQTSGHAGLAEGRFLAPRGDRARRARSPRTWFVQRLGRSIAARREQVPRSRDTLQLVLTSVLERDI